MRRQATGFSFVRSAPDQGMHGQRTRGFSLVELLVVIAIIAMMLAMLMPAVGMVRDAAKITSCSSRLRQMHVCFENYLGNNEGMYPYFSDYDLQCQASNYVYQITVEPNYHQFKPGPTYFNKSGLAEFARIFMCSEDTYYLNDMITSGYDTNRNWLDGTGISHGYNYWGLGWSDGANGEKGGSPSIGRLRSAIKRPDNTILSCDTQRTPWLGPGNPTDTCGYARADYGPYPRHKRNTICNVLWVDGHVSQVRASGSDWSSRVNSLLNSFGGNSQGSCYDSSRP